METATAPKMDAKSHVDVYSLVRDKIVDQLAKGIVPWQKPMNRRPPTNFVTQMPYDGLNALLLNMEQCESNYFLTFDEVNKIGGKVKANSTGYKVIEWKKIKKENSKPDEKPEFLLKYFTVFNIAQCEKIPENFVPVQAVALPTSNYKIVVDSAPNPPVIKYDSKNPYYEVVEDIIHLSKMKGPKDEQRYYTQLFKQLIHSTGHDSRLARKGVAEMSEQTEEPLYSKEDLVGDIGLWLLLSAIGFNGQLKFSQSYASGWIDKLKEDTRLVVFAAGRAQKAVDYLLNKKDANDSVKNQNYHA